MKKIILSLALSLLCVATQAQEFVVKSFEIKVTDLTAKIDPVLDLNGEPCALIRVAVACRGCSFEGNIVGRPQENPGEYLVYVPAATRRLRIVHPDFLPLTYDFNLKIEKNCTYELRITLPQNRMPIPELNSQFLVLTVSPKNAIVFVNDVLQTTVEGVLSKELVYGEHTYRVESPMHRPQRGVFTISEADRTTLNVTLEPAFGFLEVATTPESDARVFVDGVEVGKTPYKSDRMGSGNYQVQVLKEGYYPQMQPIEITNNQTSKLDLSLKPSFALITLETPNPESEIWVSGKKYGTGSWSGRLEAGTYSVETRCRGHENGLESITVEAQQPRTIRLQPQTPIYGVLKVNSTPVGATVKLDGKVIGQTPLITNKIFADTYTLEISKAGMMPIIRQVHVLKDERLEVTEELLPDKIQAIIRSRGGAVEVLSAPAGAAVRIDGREVGQTPLVVENLADGEHTVEIAQPGYALETQKIETGADKMGQINLELSKDTSAAQSDLNSVLNGTPSAQADRRQPQGTSSDASNANVTKNRLDIVYALYIDDWSSKDSRKTALEMALDAHAELTSLTSFTQKEQCTYQSDAFFCKVSIYGRWGVVLWRKAEGRCQMVIPCIFKRKEDIKVTGSAPGPYTFVAGKMTAVVPDINAKKVAIIHTPN